MATERNYQAEALLPFRNVQLSPVVQECVFVGQKVFLPPLCCQTVTNNRIVDVGTETKLHKTETRAVQLNFQAPKPLLGTKGASPSSTWDVPTVVHLRRHFFF